MSGKERLLISCNYQTMSVFCFFLDSAVCLYIVFFFVFIAFYIASCPMPFPLFDDHFKEEEKSSSANIWHHLEMFYNIFGT